MAWVVALACGVSPALAGATGSGEGPGPLSIEPLSFSVRYTSRTMEQLETNVVSPAPTYDHLHDVAWAPDGHMAIAVGSHNALVGWDAANRTADILRNGTLGNLYGVAWSADSTSALAVGFGGALVRYTAGAIEDLAPQGAQILQGATWFPGRGFLVVGDGGTAFFLAGDARTEVNLPTTNDLLAVGYDPAGGKAVAVGRGGVIVEIDSAGAAALVASPTTESLRGIGFESDTGIGHIAGGVGVLLTYDLGFVFNETHLLTEGGYYDIAVTRSGEPSAVAIRNLTTGAGSLLLANRSFADEIVFGNTLSGVESVARSPTEGYLLATGFFGSFIMAWDNGTWSFVSPPARPSVLDAAWRPMGDLALLVGLNGSVLLYNRTSNTTVTVTVPSTSISLRGVSWAPDGSHAIIVGANTLWKYDEATGLVTAPIGPVTLDLYGVAFRPNGTDAAVVGTAGYIGVWNGFALARVSSMAITQSFFAVEWHKDATGTGDFAHAAGANIVARFDPPGTVSAVTRVGSFLGVAYLGEDVWIAGDPHQLQRYDSANGFWDNVSLPPELNNVHLAGLAATPDGTKLLLVGNQSFTAFASISEIRRFDTGFAANFNTVTYNPVTRDPLLGGASSIAFELKEGTFPNVAPNVVLASPLNGSQWSTDDVIAFDAGPTSDPDGDALSFSWYDNQSGFLTTGPAFGTRLSAGVHIVTVRADDGHGHNVSASAVVSVVQAQYAPVAVIASPNASSNFTDDDNITFSAIGSYDANVNDTLSFLWQSSLGGAIGNTSIVVSKLSPGIHTVTLTVTDNTGRSTNATVVIVVAQGDVPPSITVASPLPGVLYATNLPLVFDARDTRDPDSSGFTVIWYVDDVELGRGVLFNQSVAQGTHSLLVVADDGRKTSQVRFDFEVGPPVNVAPRFGSVTPPNGSTLNGTAILSGSLEPDAVGPVLFVEVQVAGGDWQRALGNNLSWSLALDTRRLPNGALEVVVRAVDQQYVTQIMLQYQVDNPFVNERPTVALLTPRPAASVRGLVTLAGSASDSDGTVASVDFRVGGGAWAGATLDDTSWTATLDTAGLPDGPLLIEVRSFDGQSYSDVAAVTVIVDNAPAAGGFLPGLEASVAIAAMAALGALGLGRRRRP